MKEFLQSIYDSYTDRIKNPFIGSFILSFLIFNWRPIAILGYSEWPMNCRIEWIEEKYCDKMNFWYPVFISLFYILVLPHINLFFDWCLSFYSNKKYLKKKRNRKADLEQEKDEASLIREIADAKAGTSEIVVLKERNEALQSENSALTKQNQDDLDRHNKTLEQSKFRENAFLEQIRIYSIQTNLIFNGSEFIDKADATFQNTKDMLKIADQLSDEDKSNFEKMVLNSRDSKGIDYIEEMNKYQEHGLIRVILSVSSYHKKALITPMGNLLFEYLKLGLDLY